MNQFSYILSRNNDNKFSNSLHLIQGNLCGFHNSVGKYVQSLTFQSIYFPTRSYLIITCNIFGCWGSHVLLIFRTKSTSTLTRWIHPSIHHSSFSLWPSLQSQGETWKGSRKSWQTWLETPQPIAARVPLGRTCGTGRPSAWGHPGRTRRVSSSSTFSFPRTTLSARRRYVMWCAS